MTRREWLKLLLVVPGAVIGKRVGGVLEDARLDASLAALGQPDLDLPWARPENTTTFAYMNQTGSYWIDASTGKVR